MGSKKRTKTRKKTGVTAKRPAGPRPPPRWEEGDFRSLLDLSPDWYWEQDEHYRFTRIAGGARAKTGFNEKDFLGTTRWDRGGRPAGDGGHWDRHKAALRAHQPFTDFLFKRPDPSGELRYINTSGQPVFDNDGRFRGYRGVAKDVTERVLTELRLNIEHGVTHILAAAESLASATPKIIHLVCKTLGWTCGTRWELDPRDNTLHCVDTWGVRSEAIDKFLAATRDLPPQTAEAGGLIRATWAKAEPVWIRDVSEEKSFVRAPSAMQADLHSAFAFPIKANAQVIGVMEFFSHEIHQPDAELLNATHYIGAQIGQFVQRKQAEDALRANEARFRSLTELSSDWYWEQDESLRFTRFSGGLLGETGIDSAGLIGKTFRELTGLPIEAAVQAKIDVREPFYDFEYKHAKPEGDFRYIVTSGTPVFDAAGRFTGYRGVAKDITGRKREELLLALEHVVNRCLAEARSALEAIRTSIRAICETEGWECGRYFRVDENAGLLRFAEAWGAPDPAIERYIAASREVTYAMGAGMTGKVWQSGEPLWVCERGKHHGVAQATFGKTRDVFIFPLIADGKTVGVCTFISRKLRPPDARLLQTVRVIGSQIGQFLQRKQAEEVLRDSEERFRSLTGLSSDWFWEQDTELRFTRMEGRHATGDSSAFQGELGKTREEIGVEVEGGWDAHRALLEAHRPFRDVVMWRTFQDGKMRYMSISGEPMFDDAGRWLGYRGVGKDITARKRDEQLLMLEHAVNRSLAETDNVSATLKAVIRAICETQSWVCGRYFRVDKDAGLLRYEEFWSMPDANLDEFIARSRELTYATDVGLAGKVWSSGKPLWITDVTENTRATPHYLARGTGLRGGFVFPISAEGQTVGVLTFLCREVREPDERLLRAVRVIGSQIGQFVQRKQAEQSTLRLGRMFAALSATNDAILHAKSPEELYQRVCDAAVNGGEFSNTSILLAEEGISRTKVVASAGRVPKQLRASYISIDETIPEGRGLVGIAFRTQRSCVSNDFLNDERTRPWHEIGRKAGCRSAAGLPLIQGGRSIGAILIHYEELNAFDDEIIKLLERLAQNVSFALDNFERDAERARAEEALRDSEERFRSLTSLSSDWFWEQDTEFRFTRMEGRPGIDDGKQITGTDFIGKRRWETGVEMEDEGGWDAHRALLEAHEVFRDVVVMSPALPDGTRRYFSLSGEPKFDHTGRFTGYRGVAREITERKKAEERIQYLATHDGLTELPNRAMFSQMLSLAIQSAQRYQRNFAVLFIDLDRFKIINDTLGHDAGDTLLQETSRRVKESLRSSDMVARLGGDEFVVLLQEVGEPEQVATVARKLLSTVIKPVVILGQECRVTASIGISMYPTDAEDEQALMKNADMAMYLAKEQGKNNYQFYSKDIKTQSLERLTLETSLRRALEREEFYLHYQAKLDLKTGAINGVETLLRWQHPDLGMVSPMQFIPLAEETGLIVPIGKWVLRTACAQNVAWQRAGLPPVCMAVNLSPRQFSDENLLGDLATVLEDTGMRPELLELEITESMVMGNIDQAARQLTAIKKMGVRLAIDDFGTGYSSLAQIKRFPIDTIKVDRSFIREIPRDTEDKAITEAIIAMGKSLSLTVVAEGVETQEQQSYLRDHACDEMQGFYFARPVAPDQFAELLRTHVAVPSSKK